MSSLLANKLVDDLVAIGAKAHKTNRLEFLQKHRETIKAHLQSRIEDEDWHGVSDDANDLREVDAELKGLTR